MIVISILRMNISDFFPIPNKIKKKSDSAYTLQKRQVGVKQQIVQTMAMQVDLELKKVSCTALVCEIRSNFNVYT